MEQMISGQIGQPAACMIENKVSPVAKKRLGQTALQGCGEVREAARLWPRQGAVAAAQTSALEGAV
ncbi:MAG: hypothetical protein Q8L49_01035 [Burkholderiaceae bacterium]|nr:hypothetical protein [Burkholderiaceae bacterium]